MIILPRTKKEFGFFYKNCATFLVEAVVEEYNCIEYASMVSNEVVKFNSEYVNGFLRLKAFLLSDSDEEFEKTGYSKYEYDDFVEAINRYFRFEGDENDSEGQTCNHLTNSDFISIANLKFFNEYDRCLIIKASFAGRVIVEKNCVDASKNKDGYYRYRYKVVVRKKVPIDTQKEYSIEELVSLVEARDIIIVECYRERTHESADNFKTIINIFDQNMSKQMAKINDEKKWMININIPKNPYHSFYFLHIKSLITSEIIDASMKVVNAQLEEIRKMFCYPTQSEIKSCIMDESYHVSEESTAFFAGMTIEEIVKYVKWYEKQEKLFEKAKKIIAIYSEDFNAILQQYSI